MKLKSITTSTFLFFVVLASSAVAAESTYSLIPLVRGEVWTYRGHLDGDAGPNKVLSKPIEWKEEVLEVLTLGNVTAALIKGHPDDLAFYSKDIKPGRYLLVEVNHGRLYFTKRLAQR